MPVSPPIDPSQLPPDSEPAREAKNDVLGGIVDTIEVGGILVDATAAVVQVGGLALEAGATTLKVVATGAEVVGSILGGIAEGL